MRRCPQLERDRAPLRSETRRAQAGQHCRNDTTSMSLMHEIGRCAPDGDGLAAGGDDGATWAPVTPPSHAKLRGMISGFLPAQVVISAPPPPEPKNRAHPVDAPGGPLRFDTSCLDEEESPDEWPLPSAHLFLENLDVRSTPSSLAAAAAAAAPLGACFPLLLLHFFDLNWRPPYALADRPRGPPCPSVLLSKRDHSFQFRLTSFSPPARASLCSWC